VSGRASARILSSTLKLSVAGVLAANQATMVYAALVPSTMGDLPQTPAHILTIPGSTHCANSIYYSNSGSLGFSPATAQQLKPPSVMGGAPTLVYFVDSAQGAAATPRIVHLSGQVELNGVGSMQYWA
jgi:hypothetical protein